MLPYKALAYAHLSFEKNTMSPTFNWPVRVYYEDTDAEGVVYYANYLKFYERARTEWLRSLGISQEILKNRHNIIFVVKNVSIDYRRSALLDDELIVTAQVAQLKGASILFEQTVWRDGDELNKCTVTIVCVDGKPIRPTAIPDEVAQKMRQGLTGN